MKINLNNKNLQRVRSKREICSFCYFRQHGINCFESIYDQLHGCARISSYYKEFNMDNSLFKL